MAAITERNPADGTVDVAEAETASRPAETAQSGSALAATEPGLAAMPLTRSIAPAKPSLMAAAAAALPAKIEQNKFEPQAKPEPAPLTSGVIQTQQISAIPGSAEPMKPVKVKTVQVKAGPMKLAAAGPSQPAAPPITSAILARPEVAETSSAVVAKAAETKSEAAKEALRAAMPPQPANHGTGQGVLGVLPASSLAQAPSQPPHAQTLAYADPAPRAQPQAVQQNDAVKPAAPAVVRTGWIVQVGALESESEAKQRIDLARTKASALLSKADPFTEPVVSKDRTLFRARFAGLDRDQAEAVCRTLKRADISCMTVRN
ncbi:MAG TPA: SPOR domain-containing protein [Xanthobacteraceae bacterium]|nr:SPOR domain-containing protein [Xanthobacteraceae bacterium]